MNDPLPITPFTREINYSLQLPGSKSITNRALILAALANGETHLEGVLFSRDTHIMLTALKTLGFKLTTDELAKTVTIKGEAGKIPNHSASLHVGNAGTAARFLTALLALNIEGAYRLDGDPAMRTRPMSGLLDALHRLDAAEFEFHDKPGHFPFTLKTKGYKGGSIHVDASASSQILSALLLAAPAGSEDIQLICPEVRPAYVAITLKMREAFGAEPIPISKDGRYPLKQVRYKAPPQGSYKIEPDVSAASYFLALALIQGGQLNLPNLGPEPLQGDARFVEVLAYHGLEVKAEKEQWEIRSNGAIKVADEHREIDFNSFSDTFLTYAAIAPLIGGSIRICGIGHTRHQETDRIAGMANELSKLGQLVKEEEDALTISTKPNELRARAIKARNDSKLLEIDTYEDHRFAMGFGILGCFDLLGDGKPWLAIKDPGCCGKTFPEFFQVLDELQS